MQWSPINPALFATCDGTGRLDLWNLINDAEVPTATKILDGVPAINKLRWSANGQQLVVGDDQGKISLFDVNENYTHPRSEDWQKFVRVLHDLKQSGNELEENGLGQPGLVQSTNSPATSLSATQTPQSVSIIGNTTTSPTASMTALSSSSVLKTPFLPKNN